MRVGSIQTSERPAFGNRRTPSSYRLLNSEILVMPVVDLRVLAILTVAVIAAVCDVRSGRIPNVLTFGAAAAALVYSLAIGGIGGLGMAAAGWLAGAALFFPFFAL